MTLREDIETVKKGVKCDASGRIEYEYWQHCCDEHEKLKESIARVEQTIKALARLARASEWETRHAAENTYCPWCTQLGDLWKDQTEHHDGCEYVTTMRTLEGFDVD